MRCADGERSYRMILDAAARLATLEGLEGLSIGRLAGEIGMSKSGLYAHFDSKQQLQLATVGAAEDVFTAEVVAPAMEVPEGLERLNTLCEGFLSYVKRGVFPGGCFFASAAAEWDSRRGPIRDRVRTVIAGWTQLLEANVRAGQQHIIALGQHDAAARALDAGENLVAPGNGHYLLFRDTAALDRARTAIDNRLPAPSAERVRGRRPARIAIARSARPGIAQAPSSAP
jgi:AcrR family transcriptional regulator